MPDDLCLDCGHPREARKSTGLANWIRRRLGMRPLAARCAYDETAVESEVGMPGPCGCRAAAHGS